MILGTNRKFFLRTRNSIVLSPFRLLKFENPMPTIMRSYGSDLPDQLLLAMISDNDPESDPRSSPANVKPKIMRSIIYVGES